MKGVHQHHAEKRLHCCLSEFDFRDTTRTAYKISDVSAAISPWRALETSASPIGGRVKPLTLKQKARRFLRRRKAKQLYTDKADSDSASDRA